MYLVYVNKQNEKISRVIYWIKNKNKNFVLSWSGHMSFLYMRIPSKQASSSQQVMSLAGDEGLHEQGVDASTPDARWPSPRPNWCGDLHRSRVPPGLSSPSAVDAMLLGVAGVWSAGCYRYAQRRSDHSHCKAFDALLLSGRIFFLIQNDDSWSCGGL